MRATRSTASRARKPRPTPLAPIHVNWNLLQSTQLLNLYKFGNLLAPGVPFEGLARTLLNAEQQLHRLILRLSPEERQQLQESLQGLAIEVKFTISHESAGEILSVPFHIEPAAMVERAILRKGKDQALEQRMNELKKLVTALIIEEATRKMKEALERLFKRELLKTGWRRATKGLKELMKLGAITRRGQLAAGTTIEDLLVGRYAKTFATVANDEVVNEGLLIQQTVASLFDWTQLTPEAWVQEARRELETIEASLKALQSSES